MSEPMPPGAPGPLDRALRLFGDVRAGEGGTVLLMCLNVSLLLVGYYILKTVREPLILLAGGAELKSYAAAAQALALILYVPLYGWVAQRLPRQQFLAAVILFFVGCIQLFFFGSRMGVPHLGFLFFVWVGIFSLTTIAQFWSYANEIYTRPEGHRLFPLIAVGSTAGAPARGRPRGLAVRAGCEPVRDDGNRGRHPPRPSRPVPRREPAAKHGSGAAGSGRDEGGQRLRPRLQEPLPAASSRCCSSC